VRVILPLLGRFQSGYGLSGPSSQGVAVGSSALNHSERGRRDSFGALVAPPTGPGIINPQRTSSLDTRQAVGLQSGKTAREPGALPRAGINDVFGVGNAGCPGLESGRAVGAEGGGTLCPSPLHRYNKKGAGLFPLRLLRSQARNSSAQFPAEQSEASQGRAKQCRRRAPVWHR
jgi:hypothetical protein